MNPELWSCANDGCPAETWLVQRSTEQAGLWLIAASVGATPFNVAATAPVCPYCGTTLLAAQTLEYDAPPALAPALAFS
jgi:hypothetical protein